MRATNTTYTLSFAAVPADVRSDVTDIIESLSEAGPIGWLVLHTEESDLVIAEDGVALDEESYRVVARLTDKFPRNPELAISLPITEEKVIALLEEAREVLAPMTEEPALGMQVKRGRPEGGAKQTSRKATVPTGPAPAQKAPAQQATAQQAAAQPQKARATVPVATIQPGWSWSVQLTPTVNFAPKSFVPQQPPSPPEQAESEPEIARQQEALAEDAGELAIAQEVDPLVAEGAYDETADPAASEPLVVEPDPEPEPTPLPDPILDDPWAEAALILYSVMQNGSPAVAELSIAGTDIIQVDFRYRAFQADVPIEHMPCTPARVAIHVIEAQPDWPPAVMLPGQSLDKLLWYIGTNAFQGEPAPWLHPQDSYRLQRWPNFAAMGYTIDHLRMTALMGSEFFTAKELAHAAGMPQDAANRLLNAYSLMNVLQIMPPQPLPVETEAAPVALPPAAPQNGLIPWLRAKLGI